MLMTRGSTPDTAGLADDDDFLLERLSRLVNEVDPNPVEVIENARGAFRSGAKISQPPGEAGL